MKNQKSKIVGNIRFYTTLFCKVIRFLHNFTESVSFVEYRALNGRSHVSPQTSRAGRELQRHFAGPAAVIGAQRADKQNRPLQKDGTSYRGGHEHMLQDIKYGIRTLGESQGFASVAIHVGAGYWSECRDLLCMARFRSYPGATSHAPAITGESSARYPRDRKPRLRLPKR